VTHWGERPLWWGVAAVLILSGLSVSHFAPTAAHAASVTQPPTLPFKECPAIGQATSCNTLIVVDPGGSVSVYSDTTQSTYDGSDDTLVGIVNHSRQQLVSLPLKSAASIFGFDTDGACGPNYGSPACHGAATHCSSGDDACFYAGPGTTLTATDQDGTTGTVTFGGSGLKPGASTFFGLEDRLSRFDIQTPQTITPNQLPPPAAEQPKDPCTRSAIESSSDFGLTLFSLSGKTHSSIAESRTSDGVYHVTAREENGIGLELIDGLELKLGKAATVSDVVDTSLHFNYASEQATYWFDQQDSNAASAFAADLHDLKFTAKDLAQWIARLDDASNPIGFDISGYSDESVDVAGHGVGENAGLNGVLWMSRAVDPHTGETMMRGIVTIHGEVGSSEGILAGLIGGDVVLSVEYTQDRHQRPERLTLKVLAAGEGSLGLSKDAVSFFTGGLALGAVGASIDTGVAVETGVKLDLQSAEGRHLLANFVPALTDPKELVPVAKDIVRDSELTVVVYVDAGVSSELKFKAGLDGLGFGINWGGAKQYNDLVIAGYAERGGRIRQWKQCEQGTTPPLSENY